jgi:hypothetical protein
VPYSGFVAAPALTWINDLTPAAAQLARSAATTLGRKVRPLPRRDDYR